MSKVTITNTKVADTVKVSSIKYGTYFTGNISDYSDSFFLKGFEFIVSLESGRSWDDLTNVKNYQECDAEITFKPVK
jgi:hypothetical protein